MIEEATEKLDILLQSKIPDKIDIGNIADKKEQKFAKMLNQLIAFMQEVHNFIIPLSRGELYEIAIPPNNFFGSPFKEMHSRLLHLTWQAKQVANGDFSQRVDFMGDFSEAFNSMIISLYNNEKLLKQMANIDSLTRLANRRCLCMVLEQEWERMKREQTFLSVLMCDIDFFKLYNDTYGHQLGDECLKKVAHVIKQSAKRPSDFTARYGGEEFIVLMPNTEPEGALHVAKTTRKMVEDLNMEHSTSSASTCITVSVGVAGAVPSDQNNSEEIIRLADKALYVSKKEGRNRVTMLSS